MKSLFRDKTGDMASLIFVVVTIFVIGLLFLFYNNMSDKVYEGFGDYFEGNPDYNNTQVHETILDIQSAENSSWDYGFLAIVVGLMIVLIFTAYSTRISPAFFWVYIILSLIVLVLGVALSNMWQSAASTDAMTDTIARFPITNAILGSYYPLFVTAIIMLLIIFLFGKKPDGGIGT